MLEHQAKLQQQAAKEHAAQARYEAERREKEEENIPNKKLFVKNLPHSTTSDMLKMLFEQFPGFVEVTMVEAKPGIGENPPHLHCGPGRLLSHERRCRRAAGRRRKQCAAAKGPEGALLPRTTTPWSHQSTAGFLQHAKEPPLSRRALALHVISRAACRCIDGPRPPPSASAAFVEFQDEQRASVARAGLQDFKIQEGHSMQIVFAKR